MILKENPEMLLSDYSGPDNNRVRCNLLFFTEHPSSWHTILCSNMTCMRKGGISKGRQLTLEGDNDTKLTVNLYHNGTVMVQGPETSLNEFQRNFRNLKKEVQKIKKDPEVKSQAEDEAGTTSVTITDPSSRTHGHTSTPASPKIKVLKDNIAELEQDFFLFKEETTNNLQHLLNLTSHHNVQQTEQLCSAVRHLEEDNKELRQELRRVREELARREQHGHTLERLLEETRTQLHTIQQQQCVSTQPHSTTAPPQPQLNTRDVSAHNPTAPPQTQLNSLRAPSLPQPVSLLKPIRTSRGETAAALRLIHGLQHHHPRTPAENRRVKTTSSSSATPTATILTPDDCFRGDPWRSSGVPPHTLL